MARKVDLGDLPVQPLVSLADQRGFYAEHPPRALAGLQCTATAMPDVDFENQGERVWSVFSIVCACGGKVFTVVGNLMKTGAAGIAPVDVESGPVANAKAQDVAMGSEPGVSVGDRENGNDEVDDEICSPIELECGACGASQCVFDERTQGYNGELRNDGASTVSDDTGELFLDEIDAPHEVLICFEYARNVLGNPAWKDREADLFRWIAIFAKGATSDLIGVLYQAECD